MLREKFRKYIIQEKLGLLTKDELIQIADTYISTNEDHPYWLQKISMKESLYNEKLLDLILNPINENDCEFIAEYLLNKYRSEKLDMYQIEKVSRLICNLVDSRSNCYYHFDWITDEVYLIDEGHELKKNFEKGLYETLENLINSNKKSV